MKTNNIPLNILDLDWLAEHLTIYGLTISSAKRLIIISGLEIMPCMIEFPFIKTELLLDQIVINIKVLRKHR